MIRPWLAALALLSMPAQAALPVGSKAPEVRTMGALGGKAFRLNLREQLRHGPVVLYFYPKAFTQGCTLEAKAFADAMPDFRKAGARVIGMSGDDLDTLKRFSTEACRNVFPVAIASPATIKAYDVMLKQSPAMSDRTSYVIARDGRIAMVHSDLDWKHHVAKTLEAVRALNR
ncbi:peroxiredoxin [Sphingomonas xanthus]|uniref:thioredoxin-dependent peroxiredoxin n=1 Tax=Sphingomonas xanthus TaxID=2594473 RepID=A0A516IRF4_9SPHN|nr:peroxiredoxin [Sphingomonas xanthus]QDP19497.1 peroxiredoxin [Sphingomonas xanthus]